MIVRYHCAMQVDAKGSAKSRLGSISLLLLACALLPATALSPKQGAALAVLSLSHSASGSYVRWATGRGARIIGTTPLGGLVLDHAPDGAMYAALRHGAIAIAVPLGLCTSSPRIEK